MRTLVLLMAIGLLVTAVLIEAAPPKKSGQKKDVPAKLEKGDKSKGNQGSDPSAEPTSGGDAKQEDDKAADSGSTDKREKGKKKEKNPDDVSGNSPPSDSEVAPPANEGAPGKGGGKTKDKKSDKNGSGKLKKPENDKAGVDKNESGDGLDKPNGDKSKEAGNAKDPNSSKKGQGGADSKPKNNKKKAQLKKAKAN
ncbi:Hypothetical predicted protein [Cloeon dipterum]|uniref:Uncharacterized protein n=1 Tax=Cloeon dipterum TaxID=197152 RepID=A0A8S1DBP2_9INSE|nr:Hypothetical predicted protein [Cloeon dipterum]